MSDIDREEIIPNVPVDAVVRKDLCHQCPFASGQMFKWRCQILYDTKVNKRGRKIYENAKCPQDHDFTKGGNRAPSECPLRTGPVIVYPVIPQSCAQESLDHD